MQERCSPNKKLDDSLKLLAKTSFVVFIGLMLSKLLMYAYKIIIARSFGPEIYGIFTLAIMVVGWFTSFATLGLTQGILRFIPLYRGKSEFNKIKYITHFSLLVISITSIIAGVILFFSAELIAINFFNNESLILFLKYFSILVPAYTLSTFLVFVIRAFEKISLFSFLTNIFQNVVKLGALILFIFLGLKVHAVIFSYMLGIFALLLVAQLVCKYKISKTFLLSFLSEDKKIKIRKELFVYSWPLMFLTFIFSIFLWIDSFVIGYFLGASAVGIYNAAVPIAFLLHLAPEIFMQLFFPLITKEYSKKNYDLIKNLSKQVGKWIFTLNLPFLLLFLTFPGAIISIIFGNQYIGAENVLRFLSIGIFFTGIFRISNDLISMKGKSKLILINIVVASVVNIILNIIMVPKYGINGAAFSTMFSYLILSTMQLLESKRLLSIIPLKREIIKIFFISIGSLILLFCVKGFLPNTFLSILFQGSFFILVYILFILISKSFDENDWMILRLTKHKIFSR